MMRFVNWLKMEFLRVFPAFLFFFIAFNLINMIEGLFLKSKGIPPFSFYTLLIAAGVIAKILVVIDHLPFINAFPDKPLICNVVWKTFLYETSTFLVRLLMRLLPCLLESHHLIEGYQDFMRSFDTKQFLAIQILYLILFFTFVTAQEFILAIGAKKTRKMFFGK